MKSPFVIDPYSESPNTRRTLNKLIAENSVLRIKDLTLAAIDLGGIDVPPSYVSAGTLLQKDQVHVPNTSDLAGATATATKLGVVFGNIEKLAFAVNTLSMPLSLGVIVNAASAAGALANITAGTPVNGSSANVALRSSVNSFLVEARNNLSTVIMVFNRVADRFGFRRITDHGEGIADAGLTLVKHGTITVETTDLNGDYSGHQNVIDAAQALVNNAVFVADRFNALVAYVGSISVDPEQPTTVPAITTPPTVEGDPIVSQYVSVNDDGVYTGSPAPQVLYQWNRAGQAIGGATAYQYLILPEDVGKEISVTVTARNSAGEASETVVVGDGVGKAPVNTALPTIAGVAKIGERLDATSGTWNDFGMGPLSYEYQWKADGTNIAGATAQNFTPTDEALVGKKITVAVTAKNTVNDTSAVATSAETEAVVQAPAIASATIAFGAAGAVGDTVTLTPTGVTGSPAPSVEVLWNVGGVDQGSFAANAPYTIVAGDEDKDIYATARATSAAGTSAPVTSNTLHTEAAGG